MNAGTAVLERPQRLVRVLGYASAGTAGALASVWDIPGMVAVTIGVLTLATAAAVVDARTGRIPNVLVAAATLLLAAALLARTATTGDLPTLLVTFLAATGAGIVYVALWLRGGLGAGDAKLAMLLVALAASWSLPAALGAAVFPALLAIPHAFIAHRRGQPLRYGPYLVAGAALPLAITALHAL